VKTIRLVHRGQAKEIGLGSGSAAVDGRFVSIEVPSAAPGRGLSEIVVDGRRFRVEAARAGDRIWVWCEGVTYEFEAARGGRTASAHEHGHGLAAPMPGRVRRLVAGQGSRVARGDVLLILEAMKMEHAIRAPHDGVLERFHVAEGDLVEAGVDLAELSETGPVARA
jgi:3-methylcrotonyl-CoA carboxylase alpha subunit